MTVKELMDILSKVDGSMEVEFADLYEREEGTDPETMETASCPISSVYEHDGILILDI